MADKAKGAPAPDDARQVFRQFAWHLAGTIAATGKSESARKPTKPRRAASRRRSPAK